MVSKKRVLGIKKSKTTKFRKQNKTKVRKSFKLTNKSKKHHKKRKHNKSNYFFDLPFDLILHIFSFLNRLRIKH